MTDDIRKFETLDAYIAALQKDEKLAVVPLQEVADSRGVSRAAVVRMLSVGHLDEVKIGRNRYVKVWSLIDRDEGRQQQVAKVRAFLEKRARAKETVFYEPVMAEIGLSWRIPADRKRIGEVLGDLSKATWDEHGVLLSVLVHRKAPGTTTRPGPGFFLLLGDDELEFPEYEEGEEDAVVARETEKVFKFYARR